MKLAVFLWFILLISSPVRAEPIPNKWATLLKTLVETNSGTENAAGLDAVRAILIPEFEALGFQSTLTDVGGGHKVLSFDFPGGHPEVLLLGHLDTVFAADSKFQKLEQHDGKWTGPGVIDMKGGVVLMLNLLTDLHDPGLYRKIRVAFNDDEEIGSPRSHDHLKELSKGLRGALLYEPGMVENAVITAHAGVYWFELSVHGKAAHAGNDHAQGINACVELALQIAELAKLTDYKRHFTVNPGVITGGTKPNVVCENASAKFDVRYADRRDLESFQRKLEQLKNHPKLLNPLLKKTATLSIQELVLIPSMPASASQGLYRLVQKAATSIGQSVQGRFVGFASDANQLAPTGIELLVGLGPIGEGSHTDQEFMIEASYADRLKLNTRLLRVVLDGAH